MPNQEHIKVASSTEPSETTELIVIQARSVAWLTEPPEMAELIVLNGFVTNDPCSDDRCAICHVPYGTPNEDGTITEYALHFPCGHDVGNVCCQDLDWSEEALLRSGCIFCHKSVVPARYVQEQVKEIWAILKEMPLQDIYNEHTTRGPLSRAIEALRRYVVVGEAALLRRYVGDGDGDAASLKRLEQYREAPKIEWLMKYHKDLAPSFEWLLIATCHFLSAVRNYVENTEWINSQGMSLEAIERMKCEVELSYDKFQTVVRDTAHLIHESYST